MDHRPQCICTACIVSAAPVRKLCTVCERRPATRAAGKSGRAGTDVCDGCWREEFTDPRGGE